MSDLEEMGYLEHLHTSSGRKPSDKGYRLYVDKLMGVEQLSPEEEFQIKNQMLTSALYEVDKIVKQATNLLSELTKLTCIVKSPSAKKSYIKSIQLVNIDLNNILSVFVTDSGIIKTNVIRVKEKIISEDLIAINNLLNERLRSLTIEEMNLAVINSLNSDLSGHEDIFNALIPVIYESLSSVDQAEVYLTGATNIFNYPEYNDMARAKKFLLLIDDKENLKNLLNSNDDISISIGQENYLKGAKDLSIVSAVYSIAGRHLGSIGVIGPTRIPYSKVVSVLSKIIKELDDNITLGFLDDR
jgi:heat-inducible transcriptional repressor